MRKIDDALISNVASKLESWLNPIELACQQQLNQKSLDSEQLDDIQEILNSCQEIKQWLAAAIFPQKHELKPTLYADDVPAIDKVSEMMRTCLMPITGLSSCLLEEENLTAEQRKDIEIVHANGVNLYNFLVEQEQEDTELVLLLDRGIVSIGNVSFYP